MKLFCATAFTGEDVEQVTARMQGAVDALTEAGHDPYCPQLDPQKQAWQEQGDLPAIFDNALDKVAALDGLVVVITSTRPSEGIAMEFGVARQRRLPIYLFMHNSAREMKTHMTRLATETVFWESDEELFDLLRNLGRAST